MGAEEFIGRKLPASVITIERGPVARFAEAVHATSPVYASPDAAKEAGFPKAFRCRRRSPSWPVTGARWPRTSRRATPMPPTSVCS